MRLHFCDTSVGIHIPTQANITTETPRCHQKIGSNPQTKADIILQRAKPLDPSTFLCFVLSDICLFALIFALVSKVITWSTILISIKSSDKYILFAIYYTEVDDNDLEIEAQI